MSKLTFDANKVAPREALDPIPSGWYLATITKTDLKPTKAAAGKAAGKRLEVEFTVLEGEFKGRKVFDGFNIENANPVAAEIGMQQLSSICHSTGVMKVNDTAQLHDKPFQLKVGLEPAQNGYDARNNFKGCKPVEGGAPGGEASPAGGQPAWAGKKAGANPPPPKSAPLPKATVSVWVINDEGNLEQPFWVVIDDASVEHTGAEILEMLKEGMPADTAMMLQSEDAWQTAADYFALKTEEAAVEKKAPPAAPATKTPPPAASGAKPGNNPPWKKAK